MQKRGQDASKWFGDAIKANRRYPIAYKSDRHVTTISAGFGGLCMYLVLLYFLNGFTARGLTASGRRCALEKISGRW